MKQYGKILVHDCDFPGFHKKTRFSIRMIRSACPLKETHEAWYEDGEPIVIQCKFNKIEGITVRGGMLTEIQCIYDKNKKALQTVITYDDSE